MHEPLRLRTSSVQHVLHRDYETRSRASLKFLGPPKYAVDPSTDIASVAYAVDDGPVHLCLPDDPVPLEFIEAAKTALVAGWSDPSSREEQLEAEVADLTQALGEAHVELQVCGARTAGTPQLPRDVGDRAPIEPDPPNQHTSAMKGQTGVSVRHTPTVTNVLTRYV